MLSTTQIWYRYRLESKEWLKVKELVRLRDKYICKIKMCRRTRGLEFHHLSYSRMGTIFEVDDVIILCSRHHKKCHFKKRRKIPLTREALTNRFREVQREWWLNIKPSDVFEYIGQLVK